MSDLAPLLDELAANASPATTVQFLSGWQLRATPQAPFRRSNSVAVLGGDDPPDFEQRLLLAADFASRHGVQLAFQLSPAVHPVVDARLARRGFATMAPVDVMIAGAEVVLELAPSVDGPECELDERMDEAWLTGYTSVHGSVDERTLAYARLLPLIGPRAVFARASLEGRPAGVGFGVIERGWLGIYGMATLQPFRRRGVATALLRRLAAWARGQGAGNLYLQVETGNGGARALYERAGFARDHGYHYRVAASPDRA